MRVCGLPIVAEVQDWLTIVDFLAEGQGRHFDLKKGALG